MSTPRCLLLALAFALLLPGCEREPALNRWQAVGERPHILLITLDTTRADYLGCYGREGARTPHIDGLAASGVLFERAYTPVPITLPAHCSIHTGTTPLRHGVHLNARFDLDPGIPTLAERLGQAGYSTGAIIGAFPLVARFHLDRGFEHYDDRFPYQDQGGVQIRANERKADEVVDHAIAWLDGVTPAAGEAGKPWLLWTHFFDAHDPYEPPAEFRGSGTTNELYAGEIAFLDQQLGRLLAHLDSKGLREKTLIILAGDHGEALGEHGEPTHSYFVYDEVVRVPLIVAHPSILPDRETTEVSLIDVLPTVTDLLGLGSDGVDGISLRPLLTGDSLDHPPVYTETLFPSLEYGTAPLFSVRTQGWKYIHAPIPELYDTNIDPKEAKNLARAQTQRVDQLHRKLDAILAGQDPEAGGGVDDPELRERLATLGYSRLGDPVSPSGPRRDPKEMLELYVRLKEATALGKLGERQRVLMAIERLEEIENDFDASLVYRVELGSLYYRAGEYARRAKKADVAKRYHLKARAQFTRAAEIEPKYVNAHLNIGNIEFSFKNYEKARASFNEVLALDRDKWEAYVPYSICILQTGGSLAEVMKLLETALTLDLPPVEAERVKQLRRTLEENQKKKAARGQP